ncbi:hypothetical protein [Streptomyces sp. cmx-4-9]|uniref:hypothetical protein n=1 Tax=Streptomyces sp. cmx-4-9 TaxID=2790941 RepID=UPI00397FD702
MTVRADGSAELELLAEPTARCGLSNDFYSGPATWVFDTFPDESPGIRFDFSGPETGDSCKIYLMVFTDEDGTRGYLQHNAAVRYVRSAVPAG